MKNQILDELTRDSFADYLEKGETILWRGNPRLSKSIFDSILENFSIRINGVIIIIIFLTFLFIDFFGFLGIIIIIFLFLIFQHSYVIFKNRKKKQTLYAISQKRIFFSFTKLTETDIQTIEFLELKNFIVTQDSFDLKSRTFFLGIKNPNLIAFHTYNFKNGDRRHQPTLELIENHQLVAKLLNEGIQQNN